MKIDPQLLRLYAVTDRGHLNGRSLPDVVDEILAGGVTIVQLREKDMLLEDFIREALAVKKVTDRWGVPLIINDNIQVCQAVSAAGVHVGQSDMEAGQVRRLLGPEKIIGVTAKTVEQALAAQAAGADYLGCGAVFGSATKLDTKKMELDTLDDICRHVSIPVVAIGGISFENISQLSGRLMDGVAAVSALFSAGNPKKAAQDLREKIDSMYSSARSAK